MHQLFHAKTCGGLGHIAGTGGVDRLETLAAGEKNAGKIDGCLGAFERGFDLVRVGDVALDRRDLPDIAQGAQKKGLIGVAAGRLDPPAGPGQRPNRMAAKETRGAEYRNLSCFHGPRIRLLALVFNRKPGRRKGGGG